MLSTYAFILLSSFFICIFLSTLLPSIILSVYISFYHIIFFSYLSIFYLPIENTVLWSKDYRTWFKGCEKKGFLKVICFLFYVFMFSICTFIFFNSLTRIIAIKTNLENSSTFLTAQFLIFFLHLIFFKNCSRHAEQYLVFI